VKFRLWLWVLILALCLSACSKTPESAEQAEPAAPAATAVAPSGDEAQPTGAPQPVGSAGTDTSGVLGEYGALKSYRLHATYTAEDGVVEHRTEAILAPFAFHTVMGGDGVDMEMIVVNDTLWIKMPFIGWYKTDFSAEELEMSPDEWLADEELGELPDTPPWPEAIQFLPGQAPLPLMEGGLKPDGRETVNGISCLKYAVLTDYSYEVDQTVTTVEATGTIWVADQADLPPIIVQADIVETRTELFAGQETVSTTRIEYQLTAVNPSITIEPPEDAVDLEDLFADWDDPDADDLPGADVTTVDLSELDSYRLVMSVQVQSDGYETTNTTTLEWVREPEAYRHAYDMDGFVMEHLWIGDQVWFRMTGTDWMEIEADEAPDPFDVLYGLTDWQDERMQLVGEQVVNGIRCQWYTSEELVIMQMTSQYEICVADQAGIPPIVVFSRTRMETQNHTTITEVSLTDINQPITFEPPQ